MSAGGPTLYAVSYSDRVRERLLDLSDEAQARGDGRAYAAAAEEFHRRLAVYPQFGDPLFDLKAHLGQIRLGVVPPLTMRYAVLEERRLVLVAAPPVLLRRANPTAE